MVFPFRQFDVPCFFHATVSALFLLPHGSCLSPSVSAMVITGLVRGDRCSFELE